MRRVLMAVMALTALCVVSCTKEKSFEQGDANPSPSNGDLLARIVIQLGPDSATTSFSYDGNKRLLSETNRGIMSVVSDDSLQRVTRNTEGTIQKITIYPSTSVSEMYEYTVLYDAASKRYTAKLIFDGSGNVEDSVAYAYDASGRIVKAIAFADYGSGFEPLSKDTIIYDSNNNIARVITYDFDDPNWVEEKEMTVMYDSKVNPLKLSEEAIVLERYQYYGNNNPTKISLINYDMPALSKEVVLTYTYKSSGKPETATVGLPGASSVTLPALFRYQ